MKLPKIAGITLRWELVLLAMIVGALATCHLFGGCLTKEGMAAIGHKMSKGVHNDSYDKKHDLVSTNGGAVESPSVPLPEGQLFMWANNEFSGKCCENSNVSGSKGCACITQEQADFLNKRGGNRSSGSEF